MTRLADSAYPHRLPAFFLSLMLPRKGQPFPPECRNCSHTFQGVLQFRLPSAPQRYNTLDFPTENRVPTGMLLAPIGNPEPKGLRPSGHFIYFLRLCIYKTAILFCTLSRLYISHSPKTKNPTDFIFNGRMKPVGFLYRNRQISRRINHNPTLNVGFAKRPHRGHNTSGA